MGGIGRGRWSRASCSAGCSRWRRKRSFLQSPWRRRARSCAAPARGGAARASRPRPARARSRAPPPAPAITVNPLPQHGVLPVIADQFATVTLVQRDEIERRGGSTLGDLLFDKPGITGSSLRARRREPADRARPR